MDPRSEDDRGGLSQGLVRGRRSMSPEAETNESMAFDEESSNGFFAGTADLNSLKNLADANNLDFAQVQQMLKMVSRTTKENYRAGRNKTTRITEGPNAGREVRTVAADTRVNDSLTSQGREMEMDDSEGSLPLPERSPVVLFKELDGEEVVQLGGDDDEKSIVSSQWESESGVSSTTGEPRRKKKPKKKASGKKVGFGDADFASVDIDDGSGGGRGGAKSGSGGGGGLSGMGRNVVKNVIVYEVDNEVFIDIKFERNRVGWVFAFLGLLFDLATIALGLWFVLIHQNILSPRQANIFALWWWSSIWALVVFGVLLAVFLVSGLSWTRDFRWLKKYDVLGVSVAWGFLWFVWNFMSIWMSYHELINLKTTPRYLPTICLFLVWFLVYRKIKKESIFFQEWVSLLTAFVGYSIISIPHWEAYFPSRWKEGVSLNLFTLLASVVLTVWFFSTEHLTKRRAPKMPVMLPGLIIQLLLYFVGGIPFLKAEDYYYNPFEVPEFIPWCILMGSCMVLGPLFYLSAVSYLDVASLVGVMATRAAAIPFLLQLFLWRNLKEVAPDTDALFTMDHIDKDRDWSVFLWVGSPLVLIGCIVIVVFSSVKRQFIARRFALSTDRLKKPKNPYKKKETRAPPGSAPQLSVPQQQSLNSTSGDYEAGGNDSDGSAVSTDSAKRYKKKKSSKLDGGGSSSSLSKPKPKSKRVLGDY